MATSRRHSQAPCHQSRLTEFPSSSLLCSSSKDRPALFQIRSWDDSEKVKKIMSCILPSIDHCCLCSWMNKRSRKLRSIWAVCWWSIADSSMIWSWILWYFMIYNDWVYCIPGASASSLSLHSFLAEGCRMSTERFLPSRMLGRSSRIWHPWVCGASVLPTTATDKEGWMWSTYLNAINLVWVRSMNFAARSWRQSCKRILMRLSMSSSPNLLAWGFKIRFPPSVW